MAESLSNDYTAELFDGALAEIKKLDRTWNEESRAVKAQYAAALTRRDEAQADADKIKEKSAERSRLSQELRQELGRSAFALVINNNNLTSRRTQALRLGIQYETGLWIGESDVRQLVGAVEKLDMAVARNETIMHFEKGNLSYVAHPHDEAMMLDVDMSENSGLSGISINIPCRRLITRSDHSYSNGPRGTLLVAEDGSKKDISYDLLAYDYHKKFRPDGSYGEVTTYKNAPFTRKGFLPHAADKGFVVGIAGIRKTIDELISTPPPDVEDTYKQKDGAFNVWWAASLVSDEFIAYEEIFKSDITRVLSDFLRQELSEYGRSRDAIMPESIKPLLKAARRMNLGNEIIAKVSRHSGMANVIENLHIFGLVQRNLVPES